MSHYNYLYSLILSTFIIFSFTYNMDLPSRSPETQKKVQISLQFLSQLKKDAQEGKIIYKFGYFEPIAEQIHLFTQLYNEQPSNTTWSFMIKEYEKQLDFHANKYIQWIIDNPIFTTLESKLFALKGSFPSNDPLLQKYFKQGKLEIKNAMHEKEIKKEEKITEKIEKQYKTIPEETIPAEQIIFEKELPPLQQIIKQRETNTALMPETQQPSTSITTQQPETPKASSPSLFSQIATFVTNTIKQITNFFRLASLFFEDPYNFLKVFYKESTRSPTELTESDTE